MVKKRRAFLFTTRFTILISGFFFCWSHHSPVDLAEAEQILEKAAQYCQRLQEASIECFCQEKVTDSQFYEYQSPPGHAPAKRRKYNQFTYEFHLIKNGRQTRESRILLVENGKVNHVKNAVLKTRFYQKFIISSPCAVLGKKWQKYYNFTVNKAETVQNRPVWLIKATAKPDFVVDVNRAKIWIDMHSYAVLKMEWPQDKFRNFEIDPLGGLAAEADMTLNAEFNTVKNGISFPSFVSIEVFIDQANGQSHRTYTTVSYQNYRFLHIKTDNTFIIK